ncbi:hypothetical protein FHN55_02415 [Streptomyces sp. NP160]|uniref:hypothetical protein n=1 Tax=Streptomyces sp. NP160 TaxID=2586637 RepID=UPI0011191E9B|nr:hypothetical protein [Streptomyces sp. NP160]TNM69632.1 hypothetical protein FHN55_02415 [Streptomyces sp. NP160]
MRGPDEGGDELDDLDLDAPPAAPPDRTPASARPVAGPDLRRRRLGVAAGVVVLLVAVGATVTAQQRAADSRTDPPDQAAAARQLFPALGVPEVVGREMADDDLARNVGVQAGSGRLLASAPAASYWVALSPSGGVCLVVRAPDPELSGGLCTSAARAVRGVSLPRGGGPSGTLLPAGASTQEVEAAGDAELVPGLWVDEQTAAGAVSATVRGASGRQPAVDVTVRRGTGWLPVLLTEPGRPYAVVLACLRPTRVKLSLDAEEVPSRPCPDDVLVRPFTGTGEPVQVGLQAPEGLVWAAEVVTCAGPATAPAC